MDEEFHSKIQTTLQASKCVKVWFLVRKVYHDGLENPSVTVKEDGLLEIPKGYVLFAVPMRIAQFFTLYRAENLLLYRVAKSNRENFEMRYTSPLEACNLDRKCCEIVSDENGNKIPFVIDLPVLQTIVDYYYVMGIYSGWDKFDFLDLEDLCFIGEIPQEILDLYSQEYPTANSFKVSPSVAWGVKCSFHFFSEKG